MAEKPTNPGRIYLVATPIGNLEDITLRALRILKEADLIACEDTRQTRKLLNHYGISTPTISYHEHNEAARAHELVAKAKAGQRIAIVSDAGMPAISDPGYRVVSEAINEGVPVVPVPGPSALVASLAASGLPTDSFRFNGFMPAKTGQRRHALEQILSSSQTEIFFEAPHRLLETVQDIVAVLGRLRPLVIAREVTKLHEEFLRGEAGALLEQLRRREVRGEMVLLIGKGSYDASTEQHRLQPLRQRIEQLMRERSLEEKDALKQVAKERGISKSEAYRQLQREKR